MASSRKVVARVQMSQNYGTFTMSWSLESEQISDEAVEIETDILTAKIIKAKKLFEQQTLKSLGGTVKAALTYNEIKVPATKIYWQLKEGKRNYRVNCGQWSKFGVSIYPEVMEKCGINGK